MTDKYYIDTTDISKVNLFKCRDLLLQVFKELKNPELSPIQIDELEDIKVRLSNDYSYILDMRKEREE